MIYAVFLCDEQWKIKKIRQDNQMGDLKEDKFLTELVVEKDKLLDKNDENIRWN